MIDASSYTADEVVAHRAAWLDALRSGRYRQGTGALRTDLDGAPHHCCLGVAEDVRGATWRPSRVVDASTHVVGAHDVVDDEGRTLSQILLSERGLSWLGVVTYNPWVVVYHPSAGYWVAVQLADLNDDWGASFETIAAVVADQPRDWVGDEEAAWVEARRRDVEVDAVDPLTT